MSFAVRNARIVHLHVEERMTLTEVGKREGLSREWVRQIVRRAGVSPETTAQVRSEQDNRVPHTCEHCGRVRRVRPSEARHRRFCSRACKSADGAYGPEYLLDHLAALAERLGYTPGNADLEREAGPSHMVYYLTFGSLTRAQEMAGLKPNRPGHHGHRSNRSNGA